MKTMTRMLTMEEGERKVVCRVPDARVDWMKEGGWKTCSKDVWRRATPTQNPNMRVDETHDRIKRAAETPGKVYVLSRHMPTGKLYV